MVMLMRVLQKKKKLIINLKKKLPLAYVKMLSRMSLSFSLHVLVERPPKKLKLGIFPVLHKQLQTENELMVTYQNVSYQYVKTYFTKQ